jgi:RING finger protein 113A
MRAATNIRSTFVVDYKPDICKDYKQTGFCGWGDSCKFIHDRGDYKQGWQIDRDWEIKEKARKEQEARNEKLGEDGIANESDEELDDELPVGCGICNTAWVDAKFPIMTSCKHYFCEKCALKHNESSNECYLCGQATNGTFNSASAIIKRVKEVKATGRAWHLRQKKAKITDKAASGAQGWLLG